MPISRVGIRSTFRRDIYVNKLNTLRVRTTYFLVLMYMETLNSYFFGIFLPTAIKCSFGNSHTTFGYPKFYMKQVIQKFIDNRETAVV